MGQPGHGDSMEAHGEMETLLQRSWDPGQEVAERRGVPWLAPLPAFLLRGQSWGGGLGVGAGTLAGIAAIQGCCLAQEEEPFATPGKFGSEV